MQISEAVAYLEREFDKNPTGDGGKSASYNPRSFFQIKDDSSSFLPVYDRHGVNPLDRPYCYPDSPNNPYSERRQ